MRTNISDPQYFGNCLNNRPVDLKVGAFFGMRNINQRSIINGRKGALLIDLITLVSIAERNAGEELLERLRFFLEISGETKWSLAEGLAEKLHDSGRVGLGYDVSFAFLYRELQTYSSESRNSFFKVWCFLVCQNQVVGIRRLLIRQTLESRLDRDAKEEHRHWVTLRDSRVDILEARRPPH